MVSITATITQLDIDPPMVAYYKHRREALLIELRAIEDLLGIERTLTHRQLIEEGYCKSNVTVLK